MITQIDCKITLLAIVCVAMQMYFRGSNMSTTVREKKQKTGGTLLEVVVSNKFQNEETEGMKYPYHPP